MDELPRKVDLTAHPLPAARMRVKRRASMPAAIPDLREKQYRILGVDLTAIPSINTGSVEVFLAEVGPDLSRFKNASHFANWMGLPPNNKVTGGKRLSSNTRKVKARMASALRMAAQSAAGIENPIGDYYVC